MAELHTFLAFESSLLQPTTDPAQESILDSVRVAVCASINLFMEINEDEFQRYLQTFVADVWSLLLKITSAPGQVRACWEDTGCGSESGRRGRRSRGVRVLSSLPLKRSALPFVESQGARQRAQLLEKTASGQRCWCCRARHAAQPRLGVM